MHNIQSIRIAECGCHNQLTLVYTPSNLSWKKANTYDRASLPDLRVWGNLRYTIWDKALHVAFVPNLCAKVYYCDLRK